LFKLQSINTKEYIVSATCRTATAALLQLPVVPPLRYRPSCLHCATSCRAAAACRVTTIVLPRHAAARRVVVAAGCRVAAVVVLPVAPPGIMSLRSRCRPSRRCMSCCGTLLHILLSLLPGVMSPQSWCRPSRRRVSCGCDRAATRRATVTALPHIMPRHASARRVVAARCRVAARVAAACYAMAHCCLPCCPCAVACHVAAVCRAAVKFAAYHVMATLLQHCGIEGVGGWGMHEVRTKQIRNKKVTYRIPRRGQPFCKHHRCWCQCITTV